MKNLKVARRKENGGQISKNEILETSRKCSKDDEKVERRPDRIPNVRHPEEVERRPDRIPDVRHPGGMSAEKNSGCLTSGWNVGGEEFQM